MEYKGWKLFNKIILVAKQKDKNGFEQAYVVEHGNASQLKTALEWAREHHWNWETKEYEDEVHGTEFEFENEGFEVELYDSANCSSQGGKLSFWDCLIRKDGHTFRVGINSEYLLELLRATTVVNGVVQEKVFFARNNGRVGLLHKGMEEYKEALKDMQYKADVKSNKTKNHIRGHAYSSLTLKDTYIGEIYNWLAIDGDRKYRLLDKPKKEYIFVSDYYTKDYEGKTISDFIKDIVKVNVNERNSWCQGYALFRTVKKLPERVDDGLMFIDDFNENDLQNSIDLYNAYEHGKKKDTYTSYYGVQSAFSLFYTASSTKKPNITKALIDQFKNSRYYRDEITYNPSWFEREEK